ncbi:Rieske (2Fe-2S) protein [Haliea sp.]|uniref:Rieske (2Fe-2S) protein n=1 Tax=Haliea sp. TaxID=1932666 RepID=UPI003528D82C
MRFRPLEKLINLQDGYRRSFRIDELALLLVKQDGEVYLFEARCPHREHALDAATIRDGVLECPLHRYRFRLADGALVQASEESCRGLKTWPLIYEGNEVGLLLPD